MERADEIFVFPADFGWSDLGTWGSLHSNVPKDLNGNAALNSEVCFSESHNCIVNTRNMQKVVLIGMNDCIVAENDNTLLVCRMSEENRIKEYSDVK
jgi:mannose-1-phosphate guanylyltransferase